MPSTRGEQLRRAWAGLFVTDNPTADNFHLSLLLPSQDEGLSFRTDLRVAVYAGGLGRQEAGHVEQQVSALAAAETRRFSVLHRDEAQYAAFSALSAGGGGSNGWAIVQLTLGVDPDMEEAAREHESVRRHRALTAARFEAQKEGWVGLRTVLTDPVMARLWWLDNHGDRLADLAGMNDIFSTVAEVLSGSADRTDPKDADSAQATHIAMIVQEFLAALDGAQRDFLLHQLSAVLSSYERTDLAARTVRSLEME